MSTQPFDDKDVVYRFTATKTGSEYVYLREKYGYSLYYLRQDGEWVETSNYHFLVTYLLKEREELVVERDNWQFRLGKLNARVAKLTAALEKYADEKNWELNNEAPDEWIGPKEFGPGVAQEALGKKED